MPALEDDSGLALGKSRFRVNITEPPRDGRTTRVHPHPEVPRVQVDGSVVLDDGEVGLDPQFPKVGRGVVHELLDAVPVLIHLRLLGPCEQVAIRNLA